MKLTLTILTIILLGSCCGSNQSPLPTKTEYIRIGFQNGKESYLQIQGTGRYEIRFDDLVQSRVEYPEHACDYGYEKIATNVSFFSVVSKEEYEIKHLNKEPEPQPFITE